MSQALGQQAFSNSKVIPLTYVLKYEPPLIGMVYKLHENDKKKRIYKIYLHGLIYKNNADIITNQLFQEHALHLNNYKVSKNQIKNLVVKLLSNWRSRNSQVLGKGSQGNAGRSNKESTQEILNMNLTGTKNGGQMNIQDYEFGSSGKKYGYDDELDNNIENFSPEQDNLELEDVDFEDSNKKSYNTKSGKAALFKNLASNQQQHNDDLDDILDDPEHFGSHSDRY